MEKTTRFTTGLVAMALAFLAAPGGSGTAWADSGGHTVVFAVDGQASGQVAQALAAHVESPNSPGSTAAFRAALKKKGIRTLTVPKGKGAAWVEKARAAALAAHADVAVLVVVRKAKGPKRLHVWVIDAHGSGPATFDRDVGSAASPRQEADAAWAAAEPYIPRPSATAAPSAPSAPAAAEPAAAPTPEKEPEEKTAHEEEEEKPEEKKPAKKAAGEAAPAGGSTRADALLIAQLSLEAGGRHYTYTDRLTPQLRNYDLTAAPVASLSLELYPLARQGGFVGGLGVTADYARAFGLSSEDSQGVKVDTTWQAYDLGARSRIPLGAAVLGFNLGYGALDYTFTAPSSFGGILPSAGYRFVRAGADLRVLVNSFWLYGGLDYLAVLKAGDLDTYFPHESVGGIEARAGVGYAVTPHVELSLGLRYTRFFSSMNPVPGDDDVAGGAVDQLPRVWFGVGYLL